MVYLYNGLLVSNKKKKNGQNTDICFNTGKPQKCYGKWRKAEQMTEYCMIHVNEISKEEKLTDTENISVVGFPGSKD